MKDHDELLEQLREQMVRDFDKYLFPNPNSPAATLGMKLTLVHQIENVYFIDWRKPKDEKPNNFIS